MMAFQTLFDQGGVVVEQFDDETWVIADKDEDGNTTGVLDPDQRLALARALHPESAEVVDAALFWLNESETVTTCERLEAAVYAYQDATTPDRAGGGG